MSILRTLFSWVSHFTLFRFNSILLHYPYRQFNEFGWKQIYLLEALFKYGILSVCCLFFMEIDTTSACLTAGQDAFYSTPYYLLDPEVEHSVEDEINDFFIRTGPSSLQIAVVLTIVLISLICGIADFPGHN